MRPITLAGFDDRFAGDADPWRTFSDADEARKRAAIVRGLGAGTLGRVLELGAGNGSNSVVLADRALRLDATEGTPEGTGLTAAALRKRARTSAARAVPPPVPTAMRARAYVLALPARFPRAAYDAIVIAELLYYLSPRDMRAVARAAGAALRPGGRLVLAHHRIDFHDFAQHAAHIHERFLRRTGRCWRPVPDVRTGRWRVQAYVRA